ncbi:hypothetical protein PC116_g20633 [Phytophthora cactorum]|uniref:Uncharacterized protein n=1 Tax=Phytophthora cactorum TaxID=29920 RepID=A0A8T1AKK2_9STRA|nr:hypothetical protein PC117_g25729 [Phytophthora cactorum]KAG2975322.1 hypothetical protein PC119_g22507 [Phytophthora cactorum]KAG3131608.1 hypothetical protein C6341_g23279 [Phytophthora cactorum]KAG3176043.1 hypothetical protein PC128_g17441 [Phytophthora cactorum]KAG4038544.1 hypothetical protein PC123_g25893 [Phytophthora cactorum]
METGSDRRSLSQPGDRVDPVEGSKLDGEEGKSSGGR